MNVSAAPFRLDTVKSYRRVLTGVFLLTALVVGFGSRFHQHRSSEKPGLHTLLCFVDTGGKDQDLSSARFVFAFTIPARPWYSASPLSQFFVISSIANTSSGGDRLPQVTRGPPAV